ncbi:MAG: hypothetical protein AB8B96_00095 [Lysobacterales bacterium]
MFELTVATPAEWQAQPLVVSDRNTAAAATSVQASGPGIGVPSTIAEQSDDAASTLRRVRNTNQTLNSTVKDLNR